MAKDDKSRAAPASVLDPTLTGIDASGVVVSGKSDLELVQSGRLSLDEYVERQVDRATSHLEGRVSAERLADLRELLALEVRSDPGLERVLGQLGAG